MNVHADMWKERLNVPAYRVAEAARYAGTSPQTVNKWQSDKGGKKSIISKRESGEKLTYMQLIEVGVVAAMRKAGIKLKEIRSTRDFLAKKLNSRHPFAEYRFQTDGKELIVNSEQIDKKIKNKLVVVSANGQLAWKEVLQQVLSEFEYTDRAVSRWRVAGNDEPIVIDPRLCFGSPQVGGVPTWVIKARWESGEGLKDIAENFGISLPYVRAALEFEDIEIDPERPNKWVN